MIYSPIILSLKISVLSLIIVFIIGIPLSRIMARSNFRGKSLVESLITLPMVLPPSVLGYGLLILLSRNSLIGKWILTIFGSQIIFTWWAAVIASSVVALPLMYQSTKAAFSAIDPKLEMAARTLGAGEWRIFWTITFPLALPGVVSGLVLSFARSMGEFGATLMVAGNIPGQTQTIPLAIYFAVESGDYQVANLLVLIMVIFSFSVIFILNTWLKKYR